MNIRKSIFIARSRGVPVYCIVIFLLYLILKNWKRSSDDYVPKHLRVYIQFNQTYEAEAELPGDKANELLSTLHALNYDRQVYNAERFGPVRPHDDVVAVRVARDPERLQHLLVALARCRHIETVLVIFSLSYYDDRINALIRTVNFTRFMQIYYPFSIQAHPRKFPGVEPFECQKNEEWRRVGNCTERDARRAETKHHWWWTAHFIFNKMDWSNIYTGVVIFLEEDDYVLPDLIYMLPYAKRTMMTLQNVHVLSFGRPPAEGLEYNLLTIDAWQPPFDRGLAFNKTFWDAVFQIAAHYCMFDDVSWSYSLLNAFQNMRSTRVDMVSCMAPRVVSTRAFPSGRDAFTRLERHGAALFPATVRAVSVYAATGRVDSGCRSPNQGNGGWSDVRDHLLCLESYLLSKEAATPEVYFDTNAIHSTASSIIPLASVNTVSDEMDLSPDTYATPTVLSFPPLISFDISPNDNYSVKWSTYLGQTRIRIRDVIERLAHLPIED